VNVVIRQNLDEQATGTPVTPPIQDITFGPACRQLAAYLGV